VVNHRAESRAAFAAEYGIARQYATVEELLADGVADALVIGTPNFLHAPQAIAALKAGLHVLVEKPMAMNAVEAQAMIDAAERGGGFLIIAQCFRFHPELIWLREQVAAGSLGQIIRTKGYGVHVAWGPSGWFADKRLAGGGALADMGVHAIDAVRFLLGDPQPESVYARIGTHYGAYDVDDTGVILINWQGGVSSYVESGWWQPHSDGPCAATQIYGTLGFGQAFPTELMLRESPGADPVRVACGTSLDRVHHPPQSVYDAQMAHFVSRIREGRPPSPGGADGLASMRVLDAAYESARSGQVVHL
jgi:predicted dehydrogenase